MKPLCAICGDRPASTLTDCESWTGAVREVFACWPCLAPVPAPPAKIGDESDLSSRALQRDDHTTRNALLATIQSCGGEATTVELLERFGFSTRSKAADAVRASLRRMNRVGLLACEEIIPGRRSLGLRYRLQAAS